MACLSTVAQCMSRRPKAFQRHPSPFPWAARVAAVSTTAGLPWEETGCGVVEFFWQQPAPAHIFLEGPGSSVTGKEGSKSGQWPGDLSQQAQTSWQWDRHPALQLTMASCPLAPTRLRFSREAISACRYYRKGSGKVHTEKV